MKTIDLSCYKTEFNENISKDLGEIIIKDGFEISGFSDQGKAYPFIPRFRVISAKTKLSLHRHEFLEIVLVLEGKGAQRFEHTVQSIQKGDVFFINPKKLHTYDVEEGSELQLALFSFYPSLIDPHITMEKVESGLNYFLLEPFFIEEGDSPFLMRLDAETFNRLAPLALLVIDIFNRTYPASSPIAIDLFRALLGLLHQYFKKKMSHTDSVFKNKGMRFWTIVEEIEKRLNKKFNLDDIARSVGLGRTTVCEYFKEIQNETIVEYVRRRRLENSAQLLKNSSLRITEVAYESGFQDISYYNREFKKAYKVSPKQYRERNRVE